MPFEKHPRFDTPTDDTAIWRYMSFEKFIWLLETRSLYFCSIEALAAHDPYEGLYSDVNTFYEKTSWETLEPVQRHLVGGHLKGGQKEYEQFQTMLKTAHSVIKEHRKITYANCWHRQAHESVAMWKLYAGNNKGIAIQAKIKGLIASLEDYKDLEIFIGNVHYKDYFIEGMPEDFALEPFITKRKYFDYENELRAIIWGLQHGKTRQFYDTETREPLKGIQVPISLDALIDTIVVSPDVQDWETKLIEATLKRYGLDKPLKKSALSINPG